MRLVLFAVFMILLLAAAPALGGVGTVELYVWCAAVLVGALLIVRGSRREA